MSQNCTQLSFEDRFSELCYNCQRNDLLKYDWCREPCDAYAVICAEEAEYERKKRMKTVQCPQCKGTGEIEVPKEKTDSR